MRGAISPGLPATMIYVAVGVVVIFGAYNAGQLMHSTNPDELIVRVPASTTATDTSKDFETSLPQPAAKQDFQANPSNANQAARPLMSRPVVSSAPSGTPSVAPLIASSTPSVPLGTSLVLFGDITGVPKERLAKVEQWMNTKHQTEFATVVPNSLAYNWDHEFIQNMIPDRNKVMVKKTATNPSFYCALPGYKTDYITKSIYRSGVWEKIELTFYQYILGSGSQCSQDTVIVDVGANVGFFSGYFASTGCRVYSIELQARMANWNLATLMLNEKFDGQFTHLRVGLSNEAAEIEVRSATKASWYVAEMSTDGAGKYYDALSKEGSYVTEKSFIRTFDDMFVDVAEIYFMKMDIDGHEMKAFAGMKNTLAAKKVKHIQLEFDPFLWEEAGGHDVKYGLTIAHLIATSGYHVYTIPDPPFNDPIDNTLGVHTCKLPQINGVSYGVQRIPDENVKAWIDALPGRYPRKKNANLYLTTETLPC